MINSTGLLIRTIRAARQMHQQHLADQAGMSRPLLVLIERDEVTPADKYKLSIEAALGLQLDDPQVRAAFAILAGCNGND